MRFFLSCFICTTFVSLDILLQYITEYDIFGYESKWEHNSGPFGNEYIAGKTALIILDGWGHGNKTDSDAIYNANTPFIDSLYNQHLNSELKTFGESVGLPEGQMGNSEVGHLNIGSGRIVYEDLVKINIAAITS